jgi:anti-sigma factor RsiW
MTNCTENQIRIQLFVDGELSSSEVRELMGHTETCPNCEHALVEARNFTQRIRAARPDTAAPESLQQRLQQRIPAEQRRETLEAKPIAGVFPWRSWLVFATAAMLLVGIGSAFLLYRRSKDLSAEMMHMAVIAHRELQENQIPLDINTGSSQKVSQWFEKRVSFPFHVADAGIASDNRAKYTLVGGRLMSVGGEHVALLSFRLPDELVSLLVASGRFDVDSGRTVVESNGIALHAHDEDSTHVVSWKNRGLSYVLVSRRPMTVAAQCGRCHEATSSVRSSAAQMNRDPLNKINHREVLVANADVLAEGGPHSSLR